MPLRPPSSSPEAQTWATSPPGVVAAGVLNARPAGPGLYLARQSHRSPDHVELCPLPATSACRYSGRAEPLTLHGVVSDMTRPCDPPSAHRGPLALVLSAVLALAPAACGRPAPNAQAAAEDEASGGARQEAPGPDLRVPDAPAGGERGAGRVPDLRHGPGRQGGGGLHGGPAGPRGRRGGADRDGLRRGREPSWGCGPPRCAGARSPGTSKASACSCAARCRAIGPPTTVRRPPARTTRGPPPRPCLVQGAGLRARGAPAAAGARRVRVRFPAWARKEWDGER